MKILKQFFLLLSIEGVSERTYTDGQLDAMKPENRPKIEFDGKKYDDYQATQMQRSIERDIRKQKRLKAAYEAAGLADMEQDVTIRLNILNAGSPNCRARAADNRA